jgi:hypothetical protein
MPITAKLAGRKFGARTFKQLLLLDPALQNICDFFLTPAAGKNAAFGFPVIAR